MELLDNPLVSICIPVYGMHGYGIAFLRDVLLSIQKQTYTNIEVVISDHSTDDVIEIWLSNVSHDLESKGTKVAYYKNFEKRGNASANLNNAMRLAKGVILKPLFQDDFLFRENIIEEIVQTLKDNPESQWGACAFIHNNQHLTQFYNAQTPEYDKLTLIGVNKIGCPSVLFFRKDNMLFFNESLRWLMDTEYYYRLFTQLGKPLIIDKTAITIRVWNKSITYEINDIIKRAEKEFVLSIHNETEESLENKTI